MFSICETSFTLLFPFLEKHCMYYSILDLIFVLSFWFYKTDYIWSGLITILGIGHQLYCEIRILCTLWLNVLYLHSELENIWALNAFYEGDHILINTELLRYKCPFLWNGILVSVYQYVTCWLFIHISRFIWEVLHVFTSAKVYFVPIVWYCSLWNIHFALDSICWDCLCLIPIYFFWEIWSLYLTDFICWKCFVCLLSRQAV